MFSSSIKDVMFDNLNFMFTASNSLPKGVKLEDKDNMFSKYSAYHNHLKQSLDDRLLAWRLIERNYVMQSPSKLERAIGIVAATAGIVCPLIGVIEHSGVHIKFAHLAIESVHLFKECIELGLEGYETFEDGLKALHFRHEKFFESQPVKRCVKLIAKAFTYRFRYDLLHMSNEDCKKFSDRHFNQIVSVLENSAEKSAVGLSKEMFTSITDAIDPNPKNEIQQLIGEFILLINKQTLRTFWSGGVSYDESKRIRLMRFLNTILIEIDKKKIDFDSIIGAISRVIIIDSDTNRISFLHFINEPHSLDDNNPKLGIKNPSFESLLNENIEKKIVIHRYEFYEDLEPLLEKILLLLMRWKITNIMDNPLDVDNVVNKQAIETIFKFSLNPTTEYLLNKILKQDQEIKELKEKEAHTDEFLKQKFSDYADYLVSNKKPIILDEIREAKVDEKLIPNKDPDKLEKKTKNIKEKVEEKSNLISNINIEKESPVDESLMEIKDVIKKIDNMFNSKVINLNDDMIDEILKGSLNNESLVEKINVLFSPNQSLLTLQTTFKKLIIKTKVKKYFSDASYYTLDRSIQFWISMLSFTAFKREKSQIANKEEKKLYAEEWKKSILFRVLGDDNDLFFKTVPFGKVEY